MQTNGMFSRLLGAAKTHRQNPFNDGTHQGMATTAHENCPSFFGKIEALQRGCLRGWIHFTDNPGVSLALEVILDGILIATIFAWKPRPDRDIEGRSGCMGFDSVLHIANPSGKTLSLQLRDSPSAKIAPLILTDESGSPENDPFPIDFSGRIAHLFAHMTAAHGSQLDHHSKNNELNRRELMAKLDHIFAHITATHNEEVRRANLIINSLVDLETKISSGFPSEGWKITSSGITGVGYCASIQVDADTERLIFMERVKAAIANT